MIEFVQDKKLIVILGLIGVYLVYWFFLREKTSGLKDVENEYNKILNSDEHKVKSQWE